MPAGAIIQGAVMELYMYDNSGSGQIDVNINKLTRSWLEGTMNGSGNPDGATWLRPDGTGPGWSTDGGDYDPTVEATTTITSGDFSWYSWNLPSTLAQGWLDDPSSYYGILLKASDEASSSLDGIFYSTEYADTNYSPKITIYYTIP